MGTTDLLEKKATQAGPIITLTVAIIILIGYLAVDKLAMADRWTGSDQKDYEKRVDLRFIRVEERVRDVEMKHAELRGKIESVLSNQAQFQKALGEIRALLLEHERNTAAGG